MGLLERLQCREQQDCVCPEPFSTCSHQRSLHEKEVQSPNSQHWLRVESQGLMIEITIHEPGNSQVTSLGIQMSHHSVTDTSHNLHSFRKSRSYKWTGPCISKQRFRDQFISTWDMLKPGTANRLSVPAGEPGEPLVGGGSTQEPARI